MSIELSSDRTICAKCGTDYSRQRGYFPVSYSQLNKGIGHLTVCRDCVEGIYSGYLSQCNDTASAVRQVCRKLDLYWNSKLFDNVARKNTVRNIMIQYIAKLNSVTYAGKSYDDTLLSEGTLWLFNPSSDVPIPDAVSVNDEQHSDSEVNTEPEVPEAVMSYWGSGYSPAMYAELEQRRAYYMSKFSETDLDVGSEVLIRQICNLEVTIAKDSAAGKSIDKSVNSLNTLLGSLNLKPTQKKSADEDSDINNTPLGVWLYRYENKRPLPETDKSLKDINNIKKYIFTWMGHLCKMVGIKNGYTKLYEGEINRLRVEKPEYDGESDEDLLINCYSAPTDYSGGNYEQI